MTKTDRAEKGTPDGASGTRGLTVATASVFVVGLMAGSGVLTLPNALEATGLIGVVLLTALVGAAIYTGSLLSQCWLIVQERYPYYQTHTRYPYPAIGQVTFGTVGRLFVSFCVNATMFGACVVYLILVSEALESTLTNLFNTHAVSFCYLPIIITAILCPFSWLGTPKDFWPIAMGSLLAVAGCCVALLVAMATDGAQRDGGDEVKHSRQEVIPFFSALGTMVFAIGIHPVLPTLHADMKNPAQFPKAIIVSYIIALIMFMTLGLTGYFIYGDKLDDNVLLNVSPGPMVYMVQITFILHLFCSYLVALNPLAQEVEELLRLKTTFSWQRLVVRTVAVACILFTAESVPKFGTVLSLVGGSTTNILLFVCPPLFYLKLSSMEGNWPTIDVPLHIKVLLVEIITVGCFIAVVSTLAAVDNLSGRDSLTMPCYIRSSASKE